MNLNGKVSNPGELRTPVLLAPRSVTVQAGGFQRPAPDTAHQVAAWARWTNLHGAELWAAQAAGAVDAATLLIRYQAGLDATWYVSKDAGASWYELIGPPDDIGERHEYMALKVQRMKAG